MGITYSECFYVALGIQHAMRLRRIVICVLPGTTNLFPHFLIISRIFVNILLNTNVCLDFPYNFCLRDFLFEKELSEI